MDVKIDLQHLCLFDPNQCLTDEQSLGMQAKANLQLLVNELYSLEKRREEDALYVKYNSQPVYSLPRSKSLPKIKPLTKWQKFAQEKGIRTSKKPNLVWDDDLKEFKPRFGKNSAKNEKMKEWLIPIKQSEDEVDQYAKRRKEKKQRVEKNLDQKTKNDLRIKKTLTKNTLVDVNKSTASVGKFNDKVKGDTVKQKGIKRKFTPTTGEVDNERKFAKTVANNILRGKIN